MSGFIEWLEGRNAKDKKVRAVLRRSLSFVPGECIPAIPYIEPFIGDGDNSRWRETLYLIAGLWAAHWREGREGEPLSIGKACAAFDNDRRSKMNSDDRRKVSSTEKRFITLIDSDHDQLPHRLRQMLALLKDLPIDFDVLLKDLLYWSDEQKRSQLKWARDFYRNLNHETETDKQTEMEITE